MISTAILKLDTPKCFIDRKTKVIDGGVVALLIVTTEGNDVFAERSVSYPILDNGEVLDTPAHCGILTDSIKKGSLIYNECLQAALKEQGTRNEQEFIEDCTAVGLNII